MRRSLWPISLLLIFSWGAALARADRVAELRRLHLEAIGGADRVAALAAIKATGEVESGGKKLRFTMLAARPDRIRIETAREERTLIQAYDGDRAPWQFDTGEWPPRYRDMDEAAADTFVADAEYDDPLVARLERGFTFEDGGVLKEGSRELIRLRVSRRLTEHFTLYLDPKTYLITDRLEERRNAAGRVSRVVTRFGNYQPVRGVLLPHEITVLVDGRMLQRTRIQAIEPNPDTNEETFSRPRPR